MNKAVRPTPHYLRSLIRDVPPLDVAFAACVDAYKDHAIPSHLCHQCFEPPWEQQIIAAAKEARAGNAPQPEHYAQIYFEHPHCSGGEETIKLFTPYALRDLLTGKPPTGFSQFSYPEVMETMIQSGFWFWPERLKTPIRALAQRLFWDWFEAGDFPWPAPQYTQNDFIGPGDDILCLCTLCQIDPYQLVEALSHLHTIQADDALCGPLSFSASACTYVAADTSKDNERYHLATVAISEAFATREAQGYLTFATTQWLEDAYFRNCEREPLLADELSKVSHYYSVRIVKTLEEAKRPLMEEWPDLPEI